MANNPIVIRAKHTKGYTKVRAIITHPMIGYSDLATQNDGDSRPHFIQEITFSMDGHEIMSALCGGYVAQDPFIGFTFRGGSKGKIIKLTWVDNWGEQGSTKVVVD